MSNVEVAFVALVGATSVEYLVVRKDKVSGLYAVAMLGGVMVEELTLEKVRGRGIPDDMIGKGIEVVSGDLDDSFTLKTDSSLSLSVIPIINVVSELKTIKQFEDPTAPDRKAD